MDQGFDAMGKPVPLYRKQRAYDWLATHGIHGDEAMSIVDGVANKLERDQPFDAQQVAMKSLDLTGAYMLMSYLLTGNDNANEA